MPPGQAEAFSAVIALLPEAVALAAADGEIKGANARLAQMLGCTPAQLQGRNLREFVTDERALSNFLRLASRSNAPVPAGLALKGRDAAALACRCEAAALVPRSADTAALLLLRFIPKEAAVNRFVALNLRIDELAREIGRRQRAEAALREQGELLRVTLESIGDAVIATDGAGRVTFMNPVAEALTGWQQAEALDRPLQEVFSIVNEATGAAAESPVARVLREGTVVGLANHTALISRDGTARPIDDSGAPIRDGAGRMLGVVLVFRDVTERRAFDRERAESDRRKDEFLAMLAHELRNPLAVLSNGIQVMGAARTMQAVEKDTALVEVTDSMERQVGQLARLVDDLLDVSRITTGKISLQKSPLHLEAILQGTVETLRPAMAARAVELVVELSPEPLLVEADAARLGQVFGNLLSNAVKFSERGASVRLRTGEESGCAVVRIADQGAGIAPHMLQAVFELFTQADNSLARSSGGLGVGLTVAKRITELHGGSIEARSEGVGRGSEFIVRLPLAAPRPDHEGRDAHAAHARGTLARRRILVVDDNVDAAATLALLLKFSGHEVHIAHDGESALRLGASLRPEVILLDLGMPGMDGYEIARRLRARPATRSCLLIAVTGYGADADRRRAQEAGFDQHLTKPVEIAAIEKLMSAPR